MSMTILPLTKNILTLSTLLLALLPTLLFAADESSHKIGFVNVPLILKESPQVAAIEQRLKSDYDGRNEQLLERQTKLQGLEQQLQDSASMSLEERSTLERNILSERRQLRQLASELEEDINFKKTDEMNRLRIEIAEVIEAIAKDNGIDLVFETAVVYASDRADISNQVLERLQAAFQENQNPRR